MINRKIFCKSGLRISAGYNTFFCGLLFRNKSSLSSSDEDDKSFSSNADNYVEYPVRYLVNF